MMTEHPGRIEVVCIIFKAENAADMPILIKPANFNFYLPEIILDHVNLNIWVCF